MDISVKLFASLRRHRPELALGQSFTCRLAAPVTLAQLVEAVLGLAPEEAAIMLVNGQPRTREYVLRAGDQVSLWPPVAGGAR